MVDLSVKENPNVLISDEALYFFPSGILSAMLINHGMKCLKGQYRNIARLDTLQQLGYLYREYTGAMGDLFDIPIDAKLSQIAKCSMQTEAKYTIQANGISGVSVTTIGHPDINYSVVSGERRLDTKKELSAEMILDIEKTYDEGAFGVIICTIPEIMRIAPILMDRNFLFPKFGPYFRTDNGIPQFARLKPEFDDQFIEWKITHAHDIVGYEPFSSVSDVSMSMG